MFLDILFFAIAFVLSILPLILELKQDSQPSSEKPKWYKPMVIVIALAVLLIGTIKTVNDNSDKRVADSLLLSSKLNGDTLKLKVDTLKSTLADINHKDSLFQKELLAKFNIARDTIHNRPVVVDKSVYNTNINRPKGDIYIGGHH